MPLRLWALMGALLLCIGVGAGLALKVGLDEVHLNDAGPRRQLLAEELGPATRGWLQVLGCARHDLEVAVSSDGVVVTGERDPQDRIYFALSPESDCDDEKPPQRVTALVEARDTMAQGLGRLYGQGYRAPSTKVILEGVIGFGGGDGRAEHVARKALGGKVPEGTPLLVKGRRPGSRGAAWATVAVGAHGLLLIAALLLLAIRRALRGGLPRELSADEDDGVQAAP